MKLVGLLVPLVVVASYVIAYLNFPFWVFVIMLVPVCTVLNPIVAQKCRDGSKAALAFILLWFVSYIALHIVYWK